MSMLPAPLDDRSGELSVREARRARQLQDDASLILLGYQLEARLMAEKDRADTEALSDASRAALVEEFDLLDEGLTRANGSAAKVELVGRHVERLSAINDRRIRRRFGA